MNSATILLFAVLLLAELWCPGQADESPGFFLKITKNVPRLGKRSEGFPMKNMKTIPRIGRSDPKQASVTSLLAWLWNMDMDLTQPQLSKRRLGNNNGVANVERELNVVQPVNSNTLLELLNRNAIPSEHVKFVHWKDFDRALQADAELYAKVIHLGRDPDQRLKHDLSFSSYVPIFGSDVDGQGNDFMLYNKDDRDLYTSSGRFDSNFMQYNRL
ncbi:GH21534 [Drosophila grimshawi]|uniref:GH21534 n=2 Tax=Drosophila grimshawi TaxID=7222 RepID=B4J4D0_DROGR|nr:GH21534 [Drosophila grimshawi]